MPSEKRTALLTVVLAVLVATLTVQAVAQEKVLHSFNNNGTDGYEPYGGVALDRSGNLYGTTISGGTRSGGIAFELKPSKSGNWNERVLVTFARIEWGVYPYDTLILDASGNLYGTTYEAGSFGGGVAFELQQLPDGNWKEQILCNFGGHVDETENGTLPFGSLTFDSAGNLYGTTHSGGPHADGIVFELSPAADGTWTESVPHFFAGPPDGFGPRSNLIFDGARNLYGTTFDGGAHAAGTVYELSPVGDGTWTEKLLHSFQKDVGDGYSPWGGLILDSSGNLYGTTQGGGDNAGTVFELSPNVDGSWSEKILHRFGKGADGNGPVAGLVADASGNIYGTTLRGGAYNGGTAFKLTQTGNGSWAETILHSFGNGSDGNLPGYGALALDSTGNLYGTTIYGGEYGMGTVFELTP